MNGRKREIQALVVMLCGILYVDDPETMAHSRRVARYAEFIAARMGLPPALRQTIGRAALLHDVGKIGIPKSILGKKGALTPEERRMVAEHPRNGREILGRYAVFADIRDIVLHHHERFDGLGYPAGLAGALIPLASRIISVADTLDALTAWRPYRSPLPFSRAAREMEGASGKQFDPDVMAHLPDLLSAMGRRPSSLRDLPLSTGRASSPPIAPVAPVAPVAGTTAA